VTDERDGGIGQGSGPASTEGGNDAAALERRIAALEAEVRRREARLGELTRRARESDQEVARLRRDLAALRRRRSVRLATAGADRLRPVVSVARTAVRTLRAARATVRRRLDEAARRRSLARTGADERALVASLRRRAPGALPTTGPLVSVLLVESADVEARRRALAALDRTRYRSFEVLVVGGPPESIGPGEAGAAAPDRSDQEPAPVRAVEASGVSASVRGELILALSTQVEPATDDWLGLLVDSLTSSGAAAAGPLFIQPRWRGAAAGRPDIPDLSLTARGLALDRTAGVPLPRALGRGEPADGPAPADVADVAALPGGCILVQAASLTAIGAEPGALIGDAAARLELARRWNAAGERTIVDGRAAVWDHRSNSGTLAEVEAATPSIAAALGPALFRDAFLDAVHDRRRWSPEPLHVGITVTRDDPAAGYGDWYTGHELGDALAAIGWRVSYLERYGDRWYTPDPTIDAVVVLLDQYDIRRLPRRLVTIAWIRNWAERWLEYPWFDDYDLVFGSSGRIVELVRERTSKVASILPIASNPARFHPAPADPSLDCDVLFVGSYWGDHRAVVDALPALAAAGHSVRVHGKGWDDVPGFAPLDGGLLAYDDIPAAYASARIVVDDAASHTLPYGSVNSRVFDALATGAVVVSNGAAGVRALFDDEFPTWSSADDLVRLVRTLLDDPARRAEIAARYGSMVRDQHTYRDRAAAVRDALGQWATATRWAIRIGVPRWEEISQWGDVFFARAIQRVLERAGSPVRVQLLPEWSSPESAREDVTLHLLGLSEAPVRSGQVNLLWQISHPELATPDLYDRYDRVFVASDSFAAQLAPRCRVPVVALHQATDPERFAPVPGGPAHDLLFVANSRKVRRRIVDDLAATGRDVAIYGRGWTADLVDPRLVRGEGIPNADLARFYTAASIVLNDHWDDMRANGFLSNRLYDALAAGGFVISDDVPGIDAEFDGAVVTYHDAAELDRLIERYLADPAERRRLAERGRRAVLERHTFADRVPILVEAARTVLDARPS
jgi:spore maturation protein CgeB